MSDSDAPDTLDLVGKLLERKYRVDRRVAEGGFGVVYAGHHVGLATAIAIKVLKRVGSSSEDWADKVGHFLTEAKTIARLRHPGVVGVIDAGVTVTESHPEGLAWIVMEWLDGETLAQDLARRRGRGGRKPEEALPVIRPVLEALAEAHEAGICHRDLKPSNIMLVPGKRQAMPRVLDFGIAKVMGAEAPAPSGGTTTEGTLKAFSMAYAAPEQLAGTRTGPWTDVHALGLLLTELLADRPAYPTDDPTALFRAVFDEVRPTPARLGVDAGRWEPIVARALALKPGDRFADAGEMLAAVEQATAPPAVHATTTQGTATQRSASLPPAEAPAARDAATRTRYAAGALLALVLAGLAAWAVRPSRGAPPPPPAPLCTGNAACNTPGAPAICRPSVGCVSLASVDCQVLADDRALASDATVWFGAMFPRTGPDGALFGQRDTNAVDLARRDFAQIMSGTAATSERARPFGVVACDDAADAKRAAVHLVDDVGASAIIGFYSSLEAIDLATSLFIPRRVLAVASLNTNPMVTTVPEPPGLPRLVWRTTYNSADAAAALSALVETVLEPLLRGAGGLPRGGRMHVALLRSKNAAGAAFGEAVFKTLHFNGKSALDNGYDFREMTFEADAPKTSADYPRVLSDLQAFLPHVVLYSGATALLDAVIAPLERDWPRSIPYRPRYASIALIPKEILDFVGTSADRRRRFFGVTTTSTTEPNARLVMHYNEVFPDKITRTINPNSSYDAFYMLAYASYAIPRGEQVTGEALARAFAKLVPPGKHVDVGLAGIFDAYSTLSQDQPIDLNGATGRLDFDLATGEAPFDQTILCVGVDEGGKAFDGIESGLVYVPSSRKLEGAMRCP